jgi:hypothetical protein
MDTQQPKPEFFLVPKRHPKKAMPAGLCPSLLHAGEIMPELDRRPIGQARSAEAAAQAGPCHPRLACIVAPSPARLHPWAVKPVGSGRNRED